MILFLSPLLSEVCTKPVVYQDLCAWDLAEALRNVYTKDMSFTEAATAVKTN